MADKFGGGENTEILEFVFHLELGQNCMANVCTGTQSDVVRIFAFRSGILNDRTDIRIYFRCAHTIETSCRIGQSVIGSEQRRIGVPLAFIIEPGALSTEVVRTAHNETCCAAIIDIISQN